MRLLLVEDNTDLADAIVRRMRRSGHAVDWQRDGLSAAGVLRYQRFDLVVLDIGLPGLDGLRVLAGLRERGDTTPVLMLTARDGIEDRVQALDVGADDYLGKPFDTTELLARTRALLRRSAGRATPQLEIGALHLDPERLAVRWRGRALDLTRREFALLWLLAERHGRAIARDSIQQRLYGWDEDVASNAVDVHVHQLRRKLDPALIRTVRGVGYALDTQAATAAP